MMANITFHRLNGREKRFSESSVVSSTQVQLEEDKCDSTRQRCMETSGL